MVIRKFLHSCLLLEESGKRLLIDPGAFCFLEGKLKPEDLGPVDAILLTHKHQDHYDPAALKAIIGSSRLPRPRSGSLEPYFSSEGGYRTVPAEVEKYPLILTHAEIGALLEKEGLRQAQPIMNSSPESSRRATEDPVLELISANQTKTIAGFTIQAFAAPHGSIPAELPHNLAYLINGKLFHPGDSLDVNARGLASNTEEAKPQSLAVLALPIAGPWLRLVDALEFAKQLNPAHVIPIHDAIIKDFMLERMYAMCKSALESAGIAFHPLGLGEALTRSYEPVV